MNPPMLALVGSGEYLPPIAPLDRALINRLAAPVRVVCLPTAAGTEGPERIAYWSRLGVKHFSGLGVQVQALPVIDRASARSWWTMCCVWSQCLAACGSTSSSSRRAPWPARWA